MNQHRRRAANFTDSLNSIQHPEIDSTTRYSMSDDSLNVLTSPIRAESEPNLNERIRVPETKKLHTKRGVIHNPQFCTMNIDVSNTLPSVSGNGNTNATNENAGRDANYNVNDKSSRTSQYAKPKITSISQLVSLLKYSNKEKSICDKNCENDTENQETTKFESILYSLDNQLSEIKDDAQSYKILKRLSDKYVRSPEKFTEKLLTVIEESVIHNDDEGAANDSAIDLSRLTTEFRKMCKFIEDESAPEWPLSPSSISSCSPLSVIPVCTKTNNIGIHKNKNPCFPTDVSITSTPLSGTDILKKRFFNKMAGNSYNGSMNNIQNVSTNSSFETLESLCKELYPNEVRRSLSEPSLFDINQIYNICEKQMASLNDAYESHEENTQDTLSSSVDELELNCTKLKETNDKSASTSYDNTSCSMKTCREVGSDINGGYTMVDPDELEKTLLQDIVQKRKRCLDTARLIAEINVDSEAIEAQRSSSTSLAEKKPSNNDESKFLQTLMSCKNYQTYLEERKPLFKLFRNSNPSTPEHSIKKTKKYECVEDIKKETSDIRENKGQIPGVKGINEIRKPKYFHTPGKPALSKGCRQKKKYFHSPVNENVAEEHILKSPNAKGLYRLNYTTIMSPVGMYIRGTDPRLIKKVHLKTSDETPQKNNVKASPIRSLRLNTPRRGIGRSQQETLPKFNLSPKIVYNQHVLPEEMSGRESPSKNEFLYPKVSYKRPLHVKTIKEGITTPKQVSRVKKLFENFQSKVVIRHEGRINSAQKGNSAPGEIIYEPEDESIHIESTPNKNF